MYPFEHDDRFHSFAAKHGFDISKPSHLALFEPLLMNKNKSGLPYPELHPDYRVNNSKLTRIIHE